MSTSPLRHLADDPPVDDHDDPVGEVEDLLQLGRDQQHADAVGGGRAELAGHVLDGADVEPARRLGGDEHPRVVRQLAGQHDPLLVAARQRPHRRVGPGAVDAEAIDQLRSPAGASSP